ncbi:hypothetical protein MANES_10G144900v8 [Manihot esculenta]|uniref:Uncharacterized protein n=1 Tax=Manihot esculenta TaxID=3983 RepID=A0A2C9V8B5_MANES|nr:hypothetical protein MANES_10G144900v8 [Manihot esculenta]
MAQMSSFKALVSAILVVAMLFASVDAQEFAPAPAPAMDKGAAYSVGISGAMICSSLLLCLVAFLKH